MDRFVIFVFVLALIFAITWQTKGLVESLDLMRAEAIELGYARHNPLSGDWEWIKPKEIKGGE